MKIITTTRSPNYSSRDNTPIDAIIIQPTNTLSTHAALTKLCDPESDASAHYVIAAGGEIYQLVPDYHSAWHAGEHNARSIGIKLVNDGKTQITDMQSTMLTEIIDQLIARYGIPNHNIIYGEARTPPYGWAPVVDTDE